MCVTHRDAIIHRYGRVQFLLDLKNTVTKTFEIVINIVPDWTIK